MKTLVLGVITKGLKKQAPEIGEWNNNIRLASKSIVIFRKIMIALTIRKGPLIPTT